MITDPNKNVTIKHYSILILPIDTLSTITNNTITPSNSPIKMIPISNYFKLLVSKRKGKINENVLDKK